MKKLINSLPALLLVLGCFSLPFMGRAKASDSFTMMQAQSRTVSITAVDSATTTTTGLNGQSLITGSPTAGSFGAGSAQNSPTISFTVQVLGGTGTPTLSFEKSADGGVTYVAWALTQPGTSSTASSTTNLGIFVGQIADGTNWRVRCSSGTTIAATVVVNLFPAANPYGVSAGGVASNVNATIVAPLGQGVAAASVPVVFASDKSLTVNQGTAASSTSAWATALYGLSGTNQVDVNSSHQILALIGNTTFASTQSGSWSVTANAGTNLNTSALMLDATGQSILTQDTTTATQTTTTATNTGTIAGAVSSSKVNINIASGSIPAGTNAIGAVSQTASSSGGGTSFTNSGGYVTTPVTVDASPGNLYKITATNTSTSAGYYLEAFNAASGSVTLGTTAPIWMWPIPTASAAPNGVTDNFSLPLSFGTALSFAVVTAPYGASAAPSSTVVVCGEWH